MNRKIKRLMAILLTVSVIIGSLTVTYADYSKGEENIPYGSNIRVENPTGGLVPITFEFVETDEIQMSHYGNPTDLYDQDVGNYMWRSLLSDAEKVGYDAVYSGIKNGTAEILVGGKGITTTNAKKIIYGVIFDHPEFFWVNQAYSITYYSGGNVTIVKPEYNALNSQRASVQEEIDSALSSAFSKMDAMSSDIERVKYAHDWVAHMVDYDLDADYNQSIYSALVLRRSVCAGYARTFQYMLQRYNIPCAYVDGTAGGGGHAWNLIKLGNAYYNMDVTWDDPTVYDVYGNVLHGDQYIRFKYFNVTDTVLNADHQRSAISLLLPAANGTTYSYTNFYHGDTPVTDFSEEAENDTVAPTAKITATNNTATSQTLTIDLTDNVAVAGYYFGTNSNYENNTYTPATIGAVKKKVTAAGNYYLTVKDAAGNVSANYLTVFYRTDLNANGGSVTPSYVITKKSNKLSFPTPARAGYICDGWAVSATGTPVKSITVTDNSTYYAKWTYNMPAVPKLVATYNGAKGIGVQFERVGNAKFYQIWRKYQGTWSLIKTVSKSDSSLQFSGNKIMYTDTTVKSKYGYGYIYSVAAVNDSGVSKYNTTGLAAYRLINPDITKVTANGSGKATVYWSKVTCQGYEVQYATESNAKADKWTKVKEVKYGKTSVAIGGLKKGQKYIFRIRCEKTNKDRGTTWSQYSSWKSVVAK